MEQGIRATKREIEAQKAIGGDAKELQSKLRKQSVEYKRFSEDAGLRAKENRLRVKSGTSDLRKTNTIKRANNGAAASVNTGKKVSYNPKADYRIELSGYSVQVNDSLSKAAKELAKVGSETGYEHGVFVDLSTGKIGEYVTDRERDSVKPDYEYLKANPDVNVAFLHNHNEDTELSFPDVGLMANENAINVVAAIRNDGIITLVESNGKKTSEYLPLEYLQDKIRIQKYMTSEKGYFDTTEVEIELRDIAIKDYAREGMKVYGS